MEPFCPHYHECGGCDLQHLDYAYAIDAIKTFLETDTPIFGICLGHQLLALASGVLAIAITSVAGILDELIQCFLPNRRLDTTDILLNVLQT